MRALLLLYAVHLVAGVTVYDYFTGDGISQGLTARGQEFQLNGKDIKILSGSLHYFRQRDLTSEKPSVTPLNSYVMTLETAVISLQNFVTTIGNI